MSTYSGPSKLRSVYAYRSFAEPVASALSRVFPVADIHTPLSALSLYPFIKAIIQTRQVTVGKQDVQGSL